MGLQKVPTTIKSSGFTIVELLVVIVVIAILAAITIVAYNGIQDRSRKSTLVVDLNQAAKQLKLDQVESGRYPTSKDQAADGEGLKPSPGTGFEYDVDNSTDPPSFCLTGVNGKYAFYITQEGNIKEGTCPGHSGPVASGGEEEGIAIGGQIWAKKNVNVGTVVNGTANQTDNGTIEKYCFNNDAANCEAYGGLYQWGEAMQYTSSEGAQGVCPTGWHVPSDNDWKILEKSLGMTQAQADDTGWRGTDQAIQLRVGGSSGLNIPLPGYRCTGDTCGVMYLGKDATLWTSSESGSLAWRRHMNEKSYKFFRRPTSKEFGFSVRCLKD